MNYDETSSVFIVGSSVISTAIIYIGAILVNLKGLKSYTISMSILFCFVALLLVINTIRALTLTGSGKGI